MTLLPTTKRVCPSLSVFLSCHRIYTQIGLFHACFLFWPCFLAFAGGRKGDWSAPQHPARVRAFHLTQCKVRCTVSEGWGSVHSGILPMSRFLLPGISTRCGRRRITGNASPAPPSVLLGEGAGHAAQSQKGLPTAVRPPTPSVVHLPCGTTLASQGVLGFVFKEPDCGGFLRTILRSEALGKERTRQGGRQ